MGGKDRNHVDLGGVVFWACFVLLIAYKYSPEHLKKNLIMIYWFFFCIPNIRVTISFQLSLLCAKGKKRKGI